jgi:hypothetical protein
MVQYTQPKSFDLDCDREVQFPLLYVSTLFGADL